MEMVTVSINCDYRNGDATSVGFFLFVVESTAIWSYETEG